MPLKNIPPQSHFFYEGKWTAEMDAMFLGTLIEEKRVFSWIPPHVPLPSAILTAQANVNLSFGSNLSFDDARERVAFFKSRYQTFRSIVNLQETHWDQAENLVIVDEKMWKKIFKDNQLAKAYYYKGEPQFYNLAAIFGPMNMKDENEHSVINISDGTIRLEEPTNVIVVDSDTEEVTSHPRIRRKPFEEHNDIVDRQSTTYGNDTRNFPPPSENYSFARQDDAGSSCASNDPFGWVYNPFR